MACPLPLGMVRKGQKSGSSPAALDWVLCGEEGSRAPANPHSDIPGLTFLLAPQLVARLGLWTSVGHSWRHSLAAFPSSRLPSFSGVVRYLSQARGGAWAEMAWPWSAKQCSERVGSVQGAVAGQEVILWNEYF